jgi:hypothetical protein
MGFAADENFNGRILERLGQRFEELDVVRIQDTDFYGAPDPTVLDGQRGKVVSSSPMMFKHLSTTPTNELNRHCPCQALFLFPIP